MPRCENNFAPRMQPRHAGVVAADDAALRAYVLYPYLRAARIEQALGRAEGVWHDTDVAAAEFLQETGTTPVAQALRRAWLASLARRESWAAFIDHYDPSAATLALECQQFNARIAREETAGLAAAIRARWLTGNRLPSECEPAFQWLRAQRELPDALVAQRAELLLDNGNASFARTIAERLPTDAAAPLLERADFIENPARMLDALIARAEPARARRGRARRLVAACAQCAGRSAPSVHPRERTNDDARGRG